MMKFNIRALALSAGVVWGGACLITGLLAATMNWGNDFVRVFGSLYFGYNATIIGSVFGGIWGFVDGGVCGMIFGWLYNKLSSA